MFSSVLTGVKETKEDFMIIPGDCPFVEPETIKKILLGNGEIRYPRYQNLEGHPLYISKKYKDELLNFGLDNNLKLFRDTKKCEIIDVEDKNIVMNLNNLLDFKKLTTEKGR